MFRNHFHRKPTRLASWDYSSPGYYFVTINVRKMRCLLGEVIDGDVRLSEAGEIASDVWHALPEKYPYVRVEPFIVMPNHMHGIIEICSGGEPVEHGLSEVVRYFKTWSARKINKLQGTQGSPFWQRSFYDRIIRNDAEMHAISKYIENNPLKWEKNEVE